MQTQILDLLAPLQRERDMAMILVTHDLGVVAGRTDEIAVMYAGQIVEKAPTPALFADMRHPYTEALLRSIPRLARAEPHPARRHRRAARPTWSTRRAGCRFAPRCPYAQDRCREEAPAAASSGPPGHRYRLLVPGRHVAEATTRCDGQPRPAGAHGRRT